jgi:muconolactone D-isomerase
MAGGGGRNAFHVVISFRAVDVPESRRAEILTAERQRGVALLRAGHLERIWRVPGGSDSISIWAADDADHLHEMLTSLPIAPWTTFTVIALAHHPLESDARAPQAAESTP